MYKPQPNVCLPAMLLTYLPTKFYSQPSLHPHPTREREISEVS